MPQSSALWRRLGVRALSAPSSTAGAARVFDRDAKRSHRDRAALSGEFAQFAYLRDEVRIHTRTRTHARAHARARHIVVRCS